ncbi:helix-turn-helix transcriptional regulator [Actinotalea ferrariae]|uniref:winged helix-turn-helix transcriptional regulator n=1 Tax=Actinotalea ferrariae TaxID=1386098 RepID=UPI001C8BAEC5|nr:helix-turn-helix domain-containing protein [Actinotalea ferrariae]MBX9243536.1 helix-turn-helix transcriptional regulator [Actinotalea ferrariae]
MGSPYHQFCPVAKTMELLDERWTILVLRELMAGSEHFNDLRRGLPRMSPTLLSKRLHRLVAGGVVLRTADAGEIRYRLTAAGEELRPVVEALGAWGTRWIPELADADLDPRLLMWDLHRRVEAANVPAGRTVVRFTFPALHGRERDWWVVITPPTADVCDVDPGFDVTVTVTAELRALVLVWRGDLAWGEAMRSGGVALDGPQDARRALPRWFALSPFAQVPRVAAEPVGAGA